MTVGSVVKVVNHHSAFYGMSGVITDISESDYMPICVDLSKDIAATGGPNSIQAVIFGTEELEVTKENRKS